MPLCVHGWTQKMCQLLPDTILLHTVACKWVSVCWHKSPFFSITLFKQAYSVCLHVYLWVEETTSPARSFSCSHHEQPGALARRGARGGFQRAVREGQALGLLPGSLPSFLSAWRLLAFISGCLWFPHGSNIPSWELGAARAQRPAEPIPWCACFYPNGFGWCQTIAHIAWLSCHLWEQPCLAAKHFLTRWWAQGCSQPLSEELAHPLEQPAAHPHYKGLSALQTKPPCLQHCSHFALFSPVKDAERSCRLCKAGGRCPHYGPCQATAQPGRTSSNHYSKLGTQEIFFWNFPSFLCSCCFLDSYCLSCLSWFQTMELDVPLVMSAHQMAGQQLGKGESTARLTFLLCHSLAFTSFWAGCSALPIF